MVAQPPAMGVQLFLHVVAPPHWRAHVASHEEIWHDGVPVHVTPQPPPAQSTLHEAALSQVV